jgi:Pretoxin HINT domain
MSLSLIFAIILTAASEDPPPGPLQAYKEARASAGRSSPDQVKLALWCEAHGLTAERLHHLTLAVLADPKNLMARGLMGLVSRDGRFQRPEAVEAKATADATLAEYEAKRQKAAYTADAQWSLGVWAAEHGLTEQAKAHLTAVIRLDPSRESAWKRLGYRKIDGRWKTDAQMTAEKAEAEAQDRADHSWGPLLEKWRKWLDIADRRVEAEAGLDAVTDPYAVRSVVKVFGLGRPKDQALAVRLLGQIDSQPSSRSLAILATWGKTPEVRRAAAEILSHRDPREFVGLLIGRLRKPIRYEMGLVPDEQGVPHLSLAIEGQKSNVRIDSSWTYLTNPMATVGPRFFDDSVPFDPYGYQAAQMSANMGPPVSAGSVHSLAAFATSHGKASLPIGLAQQPAAIDPTNAFIYQATWAATVRDQQIAEVATRGPAIGPNFQAQTTALMGQIDDYNTSAVPNNAAIYASLGQILHKDLPSDPEAWKTWWVDSLGYSYRSSQSNSTASPKPTYQMTIISCFAAGTTVRTLTGDRAIETLKIGDQVLTQDTATGELRYQSISTVHHNPPSATLRVALGEEVILATGFHRFWKAGHGWVMARELKPGDTLRTLDGLARVKSIEADKVQPVFNLDVAEDADFFVGKAGSLVHDNTLPDPRLAPFDAVSPAKAEK